jgi:CheY-like chemotaxis protein
MADAAARAHLVLREAQTLARFGTWQWDGRADLVRRAVPDPRGLRSRRRADVRRNTITISTQRDAAGWAVIEIRDTGAGIAPAALGRIFEPFFTTKPVGKGTGLGLSICHGVVRSLGGEIAVHSELGRGSVFRVVLPPSATLAEQAAVPPPATAAEHRRGRLLIVDDEVLFSTSLRRLFSFEHDVTVVNRGRVALDRIAAGERFDAIVCDLMMPEVTGVELYAELQRIAPTQADRIIFLTGGAFSSSAQQFLDSVPNRWFEKPCDIGELRSEIRHHLERDSAG